jgi:uncharacterized membrane protein (DUF485 family)
MDHGCNQSQLEDPAAVAWNQRLGLLLFVVYATIYALFLLICVVGGEWLRATWLVGISNAVMLGFGLILLAVVIAFVYGLACRTTELPAGRGGMPVTGRGEELRQ